jgi:hypothetical protein
MTNREIRPVQIGPNAQADAEKVPEVRSALTEAGWTWSDTVVRWGMGASRPARTDRRGRQRQPHGPCRDPRRASGLEDLLARVRRHLRASGRRRLGRLPPDVPGVVALGSTRDEVAGGIKERWRPTSRILKSAARPFRRRITPRARSPRSPLGLAASLRPDSSRTSACRTTDYIELARALRRQHASAATRTVLLHSPKRNRHQRRDRTSAFRRTQAPGADRPGRVQRRPDNRAAAGSRAIAMPRFR